MNFSTRKTNEILRSFGIPTDQENLDDSQKPFNFVVRTLSSEEKELSWRAACTDRIQLFVNDDEPTTNPKWGITRVDFYLREKGRPEFKISLLYTIWNLEEEGEFSNSAAGVMVDELINPGRLNLGGQ
jgi:hypothetical protein